MSTTRARYFLSKWRNVSLHPQYQRITLQVRKIKFRELKLTIEINQNNASILSADVQKAIKDSFVKIRMFPTSAVRIIPTRAKKEHFRLSTAR